MHKIAYDGHYSDIFMYKELELKAGRIPKKNIGVNNIKVNASGLSYMYIVIEYSHMYMCLSEVVDYDCLMPNSTILLFHAWEVGEYHITWGPVKQAENTPYLKQKALNKRN